MRRLGKLGRSNFWALVNQGVAVVGSLANFLILARIFGPADYGVVAAALALVMMAGPLVALGADKLVVRDIAQSLRSPAEALTGGLLTVQIGAVVASVALLALRPLLLPQAPPELIGALVIAELVIGAASACCSAAYWAVGRVRAGALTTATTTAAKIGAVLVFAVTGGGSPVRWGYLYAVAAVLAGVPVVWWAYRRLGRPAIGDYSLRARVREGLAYSANISATIGHNDADKILLVRAGYGTEAGLYSIAYRIATMAWLPVLAVLQANLPRFFELGGTDGLTATKAHARRLLGPLLIYGVVATIAVIAAAPLVPLVVGAEYQGAVYILMLLAPLTLVKVAQYVPGDALTGAGRQGVRSACVVAALVVNLAINLLFIPSHGLAAALVATLVSECVYAVLVNLALYWPGRSRRGGS